MSTDRLTGWSQPMIGRLAEGEVPCAACGKGAPTPADPADLISVRLPSPVGDDRVKRGALLQFTRCPQCADRFAAWRPWATQNAANIAALCGGQGGNAEQAAARAESLAIAAGLLGFEGTPGVALLRTVGLTKHPENGPAWSMRFLDFAVANRLQPGDGSGTASGWGHLTRSHIAELNRYRDDARAMTAGAAPTLPISDALRLIAATAEDDVIHTGCYCCGVTEWPKPRVGARASEVWTPVNYTAKSFGRSVYRNSAASNVVGLVCPQCLPHTDHQGIGGELAESLLAPLYGHGDHVVFENGPALLFAGAVVRARRLGQPEPVAGESWGHLPRDENGELVQPTLSTRYVAPEAARSPEPSPAELEAKAKVAVLEREVATVREVAVEAVELLQESLNSRVASAKPKARAAAAKPPSNVHTCGKFSGASEEQPLSAAAIYRENPKDPRVTRF